MHATIPGCLKRNVVLGEGGAMNSGFQDGIVGTLTLLCFQKVVVYVCYSTPMNFKGQPLGVVSLLPPWDLGIELRLSRAFTL